MINKTKTFFCTYKKRKQHINHKLQSFFRIDCEMLMRNSVRDVRGWGNGDVSRTTKTGFRVT